MRKFYHLYIPKSFFTDLFAVIAFIIFASGFIAVLEFAHLMETPDAEQTFNFRIWADYTAWAIRKFGGDELFIIGMMMPLGISLGLFGFTHLLPDIKMFRRRTPLVD